MFVAQNSEDWQACVNMGVEFWVQEILCFGTGAVYLTLTLSDLCIH